MLSYRQTIAIEEAMRKDPSVKEAWVKRQFELEEIDQLLDEASAEAAAEEPSSVLQ